MPLLSVIIPVYNEAKTIRQILDKINAVDVDKEIIVVNDGSIDQTVRILQDIHYSNLKVIHHSSNRGKGAAFLTGLSYAAGDFIIIQDADLEYSPGDYLKLLEAMNTHKADIVLGVRFKQEYRGLFIHRLGNRFLTGLLNFLFGMKLNDCFTCYKLIRRQTVSNLGLREKNFTIETEIVSKAAKKGLHIIEVPVSYCPRSYSEGKKIRIIDGLNAVFGIIKYRFTD